MATSSNCAAFMHNKTLKIHRHKHLECCLHFDFIVDICGHVSLQGSFITVITFKLGVQTQHSLLLSRCLSAVVALW